MDGVLVDTGEFHFQSWLAALSKFNIEFNYEIFRTTFGMNNEGITRLLLGDRYSHDLYLLISDQKEETFRELIRGKVQLLPGVQPLLIAIKDASIPQGIGSSAPQLNIDTIVYELNLGSYFQALVSAAGMPSKPNPAVYLEVASRLGLLPENCIVIEDAIPGVEAARRAGMKCIAVTNTNPASDLQSASLVVDRLDRISLRDLIGMWDPAN